jgi:hypothetical protein
MIEIRHWYTAAVLYRHETATTIREALEMAVAAGARLDGARLDGARLDGARLDGARLDNASLIGARLVNASLDGARLDGARLDGARLDNASLIGARLDGARLDGARLDGARLVNASLVNASLVNASLVNASLDRASLDGIKADIYEVLKTSPAEVDGLLAALREGRIDGSAYQGDCACLVGTLANVRGCPYNGIPGLGPDAGRPAEVWFMAIRPGHTPENNQVAAITERWIAEWLAGGAS